MFQMLPSEFSLNNSKGLRKTLAESASPVFGTQKWGFCCPRNKMNHRKTPSSTPCSRFSYRSCR